MTMDSRTSTLSGVAFVMPRELARSAPRDVQLTGGGRAVIVAAIVAFTAAVAVFVGFSWAAQHSADVGHALITEGQTATGTVTRLWPRGENWKRVDYQFAVDGVTHTGRAPVSAATRESLSVGSSIDVRYVPSDPHTNDLGGAPRAGVPSALRFFLTPVLALIGVLSLLAIGRERRLLTEGRAVEAVVTSTKRHHSGHGGTHRSILYRFPLLSGALATGSSSVSRLPPVGSRICVIYDPDRPSRSQAYPFSLVTPRR
jgi:hypothetical protein